MLIGNIFTATKCSDESSDTESVFSTVIARSRCFQRASTVDDVFNPRGHQGIYDRPLYPEMTHVRQ